MMAGKGTVKIGERDLGIGGHFQQTHTPFFFNILSTEEIFYIFSCQVLHKALIIRDQFTGQAPFTIL